MHVQLEQVSAQQPVARVKDLNWGGDYGIHIVIESPDKVRQLYAHLSKKLVKIGQKVKAGEEIAKSWEYGKVNWTTSSL
ncbi:unnamed protein product [Sphagnum troendelagicum]|uniref:M23ase beta-sheet core domain-containing protein n=1 Tax=Sphagnum troendelagicum TaxID=128251 RepID=A0ABP0T753_9BRYO